MVGVVVQMVVKEKEKKERKGVLDPKKRTKGKTRENGNKGEEEGEEEGWTMLIYYVR